MKRLMLSLILILTSVKMGHGLELGEYIRGTLLDNVTTSGIFGFRDSDNNATKMALTDAVVGVGKFEGSDIFNLQAGFFGNPNETNTEENQAVNWIVGTQFRVDPIVKKYVPIKPHWTFLKSIQHGPSAFYDWTNEKWILSYQIGLSFGLDPNQN